MFWSDSEGRELRRAMQSAGADMSVVRSWLKTAEKMKKIMPQAAGAYRAALEALIQADRAVSQLEKVFILIEPGRLEKKDFENFIFRLKELSRTFDHELVVSRADSDFHMTYDTVIRLAGAYSGKRGERLILQSEIENLLSLIREILGREKLEDYEIAYFYCNRTDAGFSEIPPQDRIDKVRRVFQKEFLGDMQGQMAACLKEAWNRKTSGKPEPGMDLLLEGLTDRESWEDQAKRKMLDLTAALTT